MYVIFFTVIKHKNTIVCLKIFRNHTKFTYLFLWKTVAQTVQSTEMCVPCQNVCFVLVCVVVSQHPGLPGGRKIQHIIAMEATKPIGLEIADSTQYIKPRRPSKSSMSGWILKQRKISSWTCSVRLTFLFMLGVLNLATHNVQSKEEGAGETMLQYFEFGLQEPFQLLAVNITYCTFKCFWCQRWQFLGKLFL